MSHSNDSAPPPIPLLRWMGWASLAGLFLGVAIGRAALLG